MSCAASAAARRSAATSAAAARRAAAASSASARRSAIAARRSAAWASRRSAAVMGRSAAAESSLFSMISRTSLPLRDALTERALAPPGFAPTSRFVKPDAEAVGVMFWPPASAAASACSLAKRSCFSSTVSRATSPRAFSSSSDKRAAFSLQAWSCCVSSMMRASFPTTSCRSTSSPCNCIDVAPKVRDQTGVAFMASFTSMVPMGGEV
mmetsp:Transcript_12899/g.29269  ORF Transcript_12899/g.29269 Transcript_12899/m.29269 type:complete len:209 (-) Transcript_12899:449-1075(-)